MTEELSTPRRGRRLAAVLAGVLALGVVPFAFPAASQQTANPSVRPITDACPPDEVPDSAFTDIDGTTFETEITCVEWYGVTSGVTPSTYVPLGTVSRGQMASFIANVIDLSENGPELPPAGTTNQFPCDVEAETANGDPYVHYDNIQRLAQAVIDEETGQTIVVGTSTNSATGACFSPSEPVDRAQMATFIHHAEIFLGEAITAPSTTSTTAGATTTTAAGATTTTTAPNAGSNFFDDDDTSVHEENINAIASEGIVVGTSARTYSPEDPIRRGQMAAFLARKLDYLYDENEIDRPDPVVVTTTTSVAVTTTTPAT